ncbi:ABC-2 type transport system ATP-binding protein [Nocardia transvalensis]|uniref:ABC-2 type transport system ATP-binding protein n=1 Tax=Nocardia transvalensis TaxID=37333 RepID=A0A7W9PAH4_9NOCA|nr:ABC transporter ATP-binding protein [Nocardia transvalensis]MBB5912411.1 ABC-2 type transport system ATP-binding protein [Nocardia transvalensis]
MTAARPLAFAVTGLSKRFEGVHAVREVSFSVPAGATAALVGPPGSGKTTILRMLLGLLPPTAGSASIGGPGSGAHRAARPVGAMPQPRGQHPARSPRDHLRVYAAAAGVSDDRVDALLALTNLGAVAREPVRALPVGAHTRLALATALLGDPPLLVLDDPVEGLDPGERAWLGDYLRGHARRGGATLLTSQSLAAVLPIADQLIVLGGGAVVYEGSPRRLRRSHPDRLIVGASSPIALATTLAAHGFTDTVMRADGRLAVAEASRTEIENAASTARVQLTELIPEPVHPDRVLAALTRTAPAPPPTAPPMPYGTPP